ncbi:DUF397 domain-containing protein [Kitasatospora acidiphila]|uniref:DUF397 domain-containing protein n=1 Tax=Kitasatospora acidiphila TaxID=2567942 RepID=UPI003898F293
MWVKSSYSGGTGGNCIECAPQLAPDGLVPLRDSKDPAGPSLAFPARSFAAFVAGLKSKHLLH